LTNGILQDAVDALEEFKEVEWPPRRHEMDVVLERVPSWLADTGEGDHCDSSDVSEGALVTDVVDDDALGGVFDDDRGEEEEEEEEGSERGDIVVRPDAPVKVIDSNSSNEYVTAINDERAKMLHEDLFTGGERGNNTDTTSENLSGDECDLAQENSMQIELAIDDDDDIVVTEKPLSSTAIKIYSDRNKILTPGVDAAAMEPMHPAVITTLHALCIVVSSESKTLKMAELALECITILTNGRYVSGVAGGRVKLEVQRKNRDNQSAVITHQHHQQTEQSATAGHDGRDAGLSFLGYVIESITRASDLPSESVQGGMAKALLAVMTCPKCGVHEAAMLQAVRSTFHVYLVGKSPAGKELARSTLVDILKCVFMRMEAYDIVSKSSCGGTTVNSIPSAVQSVASGEDIVGAFASQYHTDSYLLFRALCKLSSKTLPGDEKALQINTPGSAMGGNFFSSTPFVDPLALNSKILSMELILVVLEHCGDAFRTGEKFVYAVRSYLCVSLLKNCMSNQTVVAHLSLKIFLLLVRNFKTHLKAEIEVFVANIFLRVLESPNSPFEQKVLVLEALRALCADPQMLTQLFLNYDCDFDAVNLYKDIVHHVTRISAKACASKLTGGSGNTSKKSADQELDLSRAGLEVLVVILRSFLKSLGLPGGDDVFDELDGTSSLSKLRESLKIEMGDDSTTAISDTEKQSSSKGSNTSFDKMENVASRFDRKISGESSDVADKIVDVFDKKRTRDQNFAIGRVKFKLDFKDGLKFFIENGVVELDALDIARFLYSNKEELDKTQIGEVLGKEIDAAFVNVKDLDPDMGGKGFYLRVLCHYVDIMDFAGLMFDDAIRTFLSGFRLPGEAQKVSQVSQLFNNRISLIMLIS
jgi:brefeldin A-inhibited guanine nucleotide-exchange protein